MNGKKLWGLKYVQRWVSGQQSLSRGRRCLNYCECHILHTNSFRFIILVHFQCGIVQVNIHVKACHATIIITTACAETSFGRRSMNHSTTHFNECKLPVKSLKTYTVRVLSLCLTNNIFCRNLNPRRWCNSGSFTQLANLFAKRL